MLIIYAVIYDYTKLQLRDCYKTPNYSMYVVLYVGNNIHNFLEICIVDPMINILIVKSFLQENSAMSLQAI